MRKRLLKRFRKVIYGSLLGLAISSLAQAQPMISSFSPGSGPVSTTVTIVGTGFNTTASQNIVFFGSTQAAVQASSGGTSLTVIAPYGADYRCISVANLGTNLVGYSAIPFVATYTPVGDNTFRPKVELTSGLGANARFVAFSDVNNDGKPDLLVANSDNTISIFPNQVTSITGTAMFGSAVTLGTSSGAFSSALSVGDFDGDGKLDIAAVFSGAASAFLYRNTTSSSGATPTFAAGVTVTVATNPDAVSVGDFDADGLVDIVVTSDLATNNLTVLRNTGNFIFVPVATVSVGTNPDAVVVGDFDQDGKSDLAVANHGSNNVSVLRNASTMVGVINWDSPVTLSAGTAPSSIVVGDMDGDTLLDIGVSNLGSNTISTFLNSSTSGTISFGTNVDFSTGASPTSVAMGDTNGDGLSDIVLANLGDNTVSILQNTSSVGSIAFATSSDVSNASITSPSAIVVDDINQDGKPDLLLATGGTSNNVAVFLQRIAQTLTITSPNVVVVDGTLTATLTSTATSGGGTLTYSMLNNTGSAIVDPVTGVVTAVSAGNVILILTSSGDTDYATAATSQTITIGQATPTLTITSANEMVFDTTMTTAVNTTASFGRGGNITFSVFGGSGSATVDPNSGLITPVQAGTITLTASSVGDVDYNPATTNQLISIYPATPTLTITSANATVVDGALQASLTTTASQDIGTLSYAITNGDTGSALVDGNGLLTAISAGQVTLTITSAGNTNYNSASVSQNISIGQATPTLTITSANEMVFDTTMTTAVNTTASFGRGGNITFSVFGGSGSATVDPNSGLITPVQAGTITLTASSAGDVDYNPATTNQLISIYPATPTLTITSANATVVDGALQASLTTTASQDIGTLSYAITNGDTGSALVDGNGLLTAISAGQVTLTITSAGNTNYNSASVSQNISIGQATPTLTITSANEMVFDTTMTTAVNTTASFGRGGNITFSVFGGSGSATVDPNSGLITPVQAGTITLTASSAGDADYNPATTNQLISIYPATPTLTITSANATVVDGALQASLTTTASQDIGTLSYAITNGDTGSALVDGNGLLTAISAGQVTLTITSAGNTNYNSASVSQNISIGQATPTLTITSANEMVFDTTMTTAVNTTASFGRGGNITFSVFGGSGSATVDPNSGLITPVQAGTITLTASSAGDVDYNPATTNQLISIYPATPTLTITSANATVVDGALQASLTTTASQDIGTLSYAITNGDTGSALVDGNGLLTAISAGQVTLTITSAGNTNYNSASVSQNISIGQATPTLTITSANEMVFDTTMTTAVNTTASFGRGGNITFSVFGGSGSATVDPNSGLITPVQAGTITLTASSAGDADYNPATTNQLISIYPATPTLTITSANATVVDGALQASLTTTASHPIGTLSYSILNNTGSALVNSSGVVRAVQHGIVFLKITSSGNTNYNSATTSQAITINKSTPTLTITSSNIIPVGGTLTATVLSTATYNRGGAKAFAIVSGSGSATVNPSTGYIQAVSAGTVTLTVVTSGDADYYTASTSQLITIGKTTPTLTITSSSALVVGNTLTVMASTTAGVGNGGAMAFALIGGSGSATINSSTGLMTAINAGAVTVMVSTAGDINYNASSTSQLITISKATPTLNITSGNTMSVDGSLSATATTTATGGRGGAFSYSIGVGSGSATVNSSTGRIRAIDAGTVTLLVSTSGDANYNAASTSQIITINKVTPTLTITSGNAVSGTLSATVTTTATGGRGGAITFAIVTGSGSATVNPNTGYIQAISAGTVTLVVSSAGDADYNPATSNQLLSVGKNTQILTITSANTLAVDGVLTASVTTTAGDGGGTITYSVINGTGSIVVNSSTGVIRAVQVGTVTLKATSSGNTNYASANTTQVFTITKGTPTLSITSASTMMVSSTLTATVVTTATYGRGGSKTFSIVGGSGSATVNASTGLIQSISSGTVTLTVVTSGDANYYSATASQLITIGGGMLMVKPVNKVPVDNPLPPEKGGTVFNPTDDPIVAEEDIVISQVLSPNGDGLNDVLDVKHIEKYSNNELVIADRRGEAVFKAHGYNNDTIVFAGLSDTGVQLEDGIYYYTLVWYDHGSMNRKLGYFKLKRQ